MLQRIALPLLSVLVIGPTAALAQPAALEEPAIPAPAVTKVLPADIVGVLLLNTTKDNWGTLNRFNPLPFELSGPGFLPLLPAGTNFSADVQPWVGEWAAVALMIPQPPTEGELPNFADSTLTVASVTDVEGVNAYVAKVRETQAEPPIEREYNGVTILEWPAQEPPVLEEPVEAPLPTESPETLPEEELPAPTPSPEGEQSPPATNPPQSLSFFSRFLPSSTLPLPLARFLPAQSQQIAVGSEPSEPEEVPEPVPLGRAGLAIAVLPGYFATSTTGKAIEQFIDSQAGIKPLAEAAKFQRTLKHPQFSTSLMVGYSNIASAAQIVPTVSLPTPPEGSLPLPLPSGEFYTALLKNLAETYDTLEGFVWVQPEGIRAQSAAYYTTPNPENATELTPNGDGILAKLPASTYMSSSSRNFQKQWSRMVKLYGEEGQSFLDIFRDGIRSVTGLDLEEDIISWMDGEFSLFFFPSAQGLFPQAAPAFKLGMGLMIQTSDRPAAERMLNQLEESVTTSSGSTVSITRREGSSPLTSWEAPMPGKAPQSFFAYRWADDNTLILTSGSGPMSLLTPEPSQPLANSYIFQTATESFPRPNEGYFYLNWGATLSFIYTFFPLDDSESSRFIKQGLGMIRSFSGSNSATPEKEQSDILFVIAPAQ
ncbi:DUF3352 domain-containing protein [Microcoleus sp. FACHB-672]|uniref:DUF3352 domain-containing protein n=1 Tax=Microcoleus sp. FACHB-672 TaxID=2692825 RepID=UPI00168A0F02|nr:DUF3352 domain-containing protein [Microcoleus sp. FACHB-672]MBD2043895.1 DUF3352 domain-containing protein [Microcoleus sp. FACHB-672]